MATAAERAKLAAAMKPKKRSKYGNKRTVVGNEKFDSKKEAKRWAELLLLNKAGVVTDLLRQFNIPLHALGGEMIGHYRADFIYRQGGKTICEDVKGGNATKTDLYKWKKKHVKAQHNIDIVEI